MQFELPPSYYLPAEDVFYEERKAMERDRISWFNPTPAMEEWRAWMDEKLSKPSLIEISTPASIAAKGLNVRCDECSRRFRAASYLKAHKRAEHQKLPFPCDFPGCDAKYFWVHKLVSHKLKHH